MIADTETAAVEPDGDVKSLIAEFEAMEAPEEAPDDMEAMEQPEATTGDPVADDLIDRLNGTLNWAAERQRQDAEAAVQSDIDSAVKFVAQGAEGANERTVRGMLYAEYYENPAFQQAFNARDISPGIFQNHLRRMTSEMQADIAARPDPTATADAEAVTQAVLTAARDSGNPGPSEISHEVARGLSDEKLEAYLKEHSK